MKKLRFFDSLKFVLAAVACIFAFAPAHADIPAGYTQITSGDTTNYPNTLTGYTKYTITNASWEYVSASSGGEGYIRYQISPENIVGDGAQISNMFKSASIVASNKVIGFSFYYSTGVRKTFVSVRDNIKFTDVSAQTYFTAHPLIILVKTTTPTDNVYQLVKRDSDGVIGYYCATGTNAGDFVPAFGAMEYNPIKIATTRYNEEQFEPVQNRLSDAMDAVDTVVTQTMTQAQQIDQIATSKQTRPDEGCTAKYCLLVEDEDGTPHWYPIAGANGVEYVLPSGYTQLEYIESDGASYLIVPYRVNNKTVFYARYNQMQKGTNTASAVFGVTSTPDTSKANYGILRLLASANNFNRMGWGNNVSGSVIDVNAPQNLDTWYEVLYDQNKLYQDNVLYATSATSNDTEWVANYDLGIFARNSATVTMPAIAKISSVWAKEDGVYKVNLVPVKRNSDNVLGMYDLVSGQFFTNQGTGVFGEGPVVE